MRGLLVGLGRGGIFGTGGEQARGRDGQVGVLDGGAVATHVDGVHDGEGAADSKDEAEEDADEGAGEEVHDGAMVCPGLGGRGGRAVRLQDRARLDGSRGGRGEDQARGGVGVVVAEGKVATVEVDEEVGEDKQSDQDDSGEDDHEEKVGFVGCGLLNFHTR